MPKNGFRLFVVSLHDGNTQTDQDFTKAQARTLPGASSAPAAVDYRDALEDDVNNSSETHNFNVPSSENSSSETGKSMGSSARLNNATRTGACVRIWFEAGPINADGTSADPTGSTGDVDLNGRSTLHEYRASLLVQPGGKRALLAVETRGASCPWNLLRRSLRRSSGVPWRLKVHENVADAAAVRSFVNKGEVREVELTEWTFDSDGQRDSRQVTLRSRVKAKLRESNKNRMLEWIKHGKQKDHQIWRQEAKAVQKEFFSAGVDIPFNDVGFVVTNGTQQRILKPSTDYSRFTYHVADDIVDDDTFFNQAEQEASLLINGVQPVGKGG